MAELSSQHAEPFWTRRIVLVSLALVAAFLLVLYLEGRPAWCKPGPAIWSAAWTRCTSQNFLDP